MTEPGDFACLALGSGLASLWLSLIGSGSGEPHLLLSSLLCGLASMIATAQAGRDR